ncbi:MAG TPA: discoidin domain-containing protein [Polyangia bacterium]|nr:discoidin domain-containing protein [Polyangia bacterium]
MLASAACSSSDKPPAGGGSGGQAAGTGGTNADAGSGGGSGGNSAGTGGTSNDSGQTDAAEDVASDAPVDALDTNADAPAPVDAINGTPDGGAYSRTDWTATSVPPFPTGTKAMGQDLKYANALDGNFSTRWSIGDTNSPAQTIGDQFTLDMVQAHVFKKILFWSGGSNGVGGPDSRDYPGGLDASVSLDCQTFGPTVASGTEPQPGCTGNASCNMPFVIDFASPTTARCVRLTLNKRLQLGGGIWWAIDELYVYP